MPCSWSGKMAVLTSLVMAILVRTDNAMATPSGYTQNSSDSTRDSKFLNLQLLPFVSVQVRPDSCTTNTNGTGVCTSSQDCTNQGGKGDGSCFNGFGVCCVYDRKCGGTVRTNNTYLINDDYPDSVNAIDNCQYTIHKISNEVCQLRLDFETLRLQGPDNTSSCTYDTFSFVGTAGANPPLYVAITVDNIVMYLDLGAGNGGARVNIATTTTNFSRSWRIKVTQIPCSSPSRAPPNCLQYYTEYSGNIKSYNYQSTPGLHQLGGQQYTACIRTREGFCGIKYAADHFSLTRNGTGLEPVTGDQNCLNDFLLIPTVAKDGSVTGVDRYCGSRLNDLVTYSKPFEIRVHTDSTEETDESQNQGFSLRYTQIPC